MMLGDNKENDPFSILHSWKILGNEQKWNAKVQELSRPCKQAGGVKNHEVELGDDKGSPTQRPEGRDQQKKKKRNKGPREGSISTPAVEVLQRMSENRSRIQEKKEDYNLEVVTRKDEKNQSTETDAPSSHEGGGHLGERV
jgi:hypothetical protein